MGKQVSNGPAPLPLPRYARDMLMGARVRKLIALLDAIED